MIRTKPQTRKCNLLRTAISAFVATSLALPAHAATSFPDYPLQTGAGSIPPNILFILDDSGSMGWTYMWRPGVSTSTSPVNIASRAFTINTLYYNPATTYEPWLRWDGTRYTDGTSLDGVYTDNALLANKQDLSGDVHTFYVPKAGMTDINDSTQYDRYEIRWVDGGLHVVRSEWLKVDVDNEGVAGAGCASSRTYDWRNCTFATPTGRDEAAEITNFATWYSYHRTRSKVAKAGASEAFGDLGENYRVGYDSIWNRNGSGSVSGDLPALPVPVVNDDGLFRGGNRDMWFDYLHRANANGVTPLHSALQRAGEYYENESGPDGPWGPKAGNAQLSCRQSYAILTSDGYWNSTSGFDSVGNQDGEAGTEIESADGDTRFTYSPVRPYTDDREDTLADVAMRYWKRDLRPDLANNVPTSSQNPAFWQHMSTFGISIGLQGTLDPEKDVSLIESGDKNWPDPLDTEDEERIDDLLHASVNGHGDFVAATDPQAFTEALKSSLDAISARKASGSNVASNGPSLNSGSHLFQATYTSGEWSGDLIGVSLVGGDISGTPSWSMAEVAEASLSDFRKRSVQTWNGASGEAFPTTVQTGLLERTTGKATVSGADNAAYIKGDRSHEGTTPGKLRKRGSVIGDIVNSSPFYAPETNNVYIGANDGMLHGVDASSGKVDFSYVPAGLNFTNLAGLSDPEYQHRFFVDGGIDVTTTEQGSGKNILVASLGRGGKGVFALDVTDPASFTGASVLWDKTFTDDSASAADPDMGHVLGAPLVRLGNSGETLAFVGNGIDSENGSSALLVYNATTGALVRKFVVDTGGANGMAEPRAADVNNDGKADFVYAGDLQGNVWKFDISAKNASSWEVANAGAPMFVASDATGTRQPITSAVALAREPTTAQIFVVFGTGRYISNGDVTDMSPQTQSIYALIDDDSAITGRGQLHERTIPYFGVDSKGRAARAWERYSPLEDGKRGWFVDLGVPDSYAQGERVVTAPFVRGRALWFSSIIPSSGEGCESGGTGFLNAVDLFTGTNPQNDGGDTFTFIDVDKSGSGDDKLADGSFGDDDGYVTSVDVGIGMPSQGTGVGNNIYVCGSDAKCGREQSPPSGNDPRRLGWRELFNRD